MCGIAGAWALDPGAQIGAWDTDVLTRLKHRGPDGEGSHRDDRSILAFRRLAIVDVEGGAQPLVQDDGSVAVTVNGEIYNHRALRAELADYPFATHSDAEVVLHGYAAWGIDVLRRLRGMFAIAIADRHTGRLILARDRVGKKPLYWRLRDGRVEWASEIGALVGDARPAIDWLALNDYLRFGYVPAPRTLLRDVWKLQAGTALVASERGVEVRRWAPLLARGPWKTRLSEASWADLVREALYDAVAVRLESEVPLGFLLSGGVDSAAVFSLGAQALSRETACAVTLGVGGGGLDETQAAAEVAARYHARHHVVRLDGADGSALERAVLRCGEPIATDALVPTDAVFAAARAAGLTTVLTGEGADEIFAGYAKFRVGLDPDDAWRRGGTTPLARYLSAEEFCFPSIGERRELLGEGATDDGHRWIEDAIGDLDPLSQMLCAEVAMRLPDRINARLDRLSMAHGIEARAPFMDRSLVELALRIPHRLRSRGGQTKSILREAVWRDVPDRVLRARKAPFRAPVDWFGRDDEDLAPAAIAEAGLVDPRGVDPLRARARHGDVGAAERLYSLRVLHTWHRAWYRGDQRAVA